MGVHSFAFFLTWLTEKAQLEKQRDDMVIPNEAVIAEYYNIRHQLDKVYMYVYIVKDNRSNRCLDIKKSILFFFKIIVLANS